MHGVLQGKNGEIGSISKERNSNASRIDLDMVEIEP
jgi:hypothetical protein